MQVGALILGELLGKGWLVKRGDEQPFLVAVAYVDASVVEDGLRYVPDESVSG